MEADKCSLVDSARQNLRLLLMTPPAKVRADPDYGCKIHWSHFGMDARMMAKGSREEDHFKIKIEQNVRELIKKFEPRIEAEEIAVVISYATEQEKRPFWATRQIKNNVLQIIVNVKAKVRKEYAHDGQSLELEDAIPLL